MNSIDNLIKTICIILDIAPLDGSYVDALGAYFSVVDQPEKPYNREVLVAALVNGVAPGTSEVLLFDTYNDFPAVGDESALYVAKDSNIIYRFDDVLSTYVILNDPDIVNPDAPEEGGTFYVRLATTTALNACTYNNGTAGVGATLTGNSNGILGEIQFVNKIDNVTAVAGDVILIKNQASALQNGIYEVTQLGSAGTPFILTRIAGYNETSEVYPSIVFVSAGSNNVNRYFTQSTSNPTIGTNNLVYAVSSTSQSALPIIYVDSATNAALPTVTYANGTTYVSLPGNGATLTATVNGALGVIGGVTMTSGLRLIVKNQVNQAHNGVYTVTNAGSATQKFKLTRLVSDSNALFKVREYIISNPNAVELGGIYFISSPLTLSNLNWGVTDIVFSKKNNVGLINGSGVVNIGPDNVTYLDLDGTGDTTLNASGEVIITSENSGIMRLNASSGIIVGNYGTIYGGSDGGFELNTNKLFLGNAEVGEDDYSWNLGNANGAIVRYDGTDGEIAFNTGGLIVNIPNGSFQMNVGSNGDTYLDWAPDSNLNIYAGEGDLNAYAGPSSDWYLGDYDGNKAYIRRDFATQEVRIFNSQGHIKISPAGLTSKLVIEAIPEYANDGAADADTDLPTGGIYKLNGNRTLFQKP